MADSKKTVSEATFKPKANEAHLIHVELDKPAFDPKTGKKKSKSYVQIFNEGDFKQFEKHAARQGFVVKILHDPRKKAAPKSEDLA